MSNLGYMHAAIITLLNVLVLALCLYFVGRARGKYGIQAPATSGHPDFDRAFRAHMNTVEQTVMFLPSLWVATVYGDQTAAMVLGYAWLAARVWFLFGYLSEAKKRSYGFTIASLANLGLIIVGFWGMLPPLVRIG
jgi:glutathione S-transferase